MISNALRFREELEKVNQWWADGKVVELENRKFIERKLMQAVLKEVGAKRAVIITGPRRVGKTVLLKQVISKLLKNAGNRNILYYSLDDPAISLFSDSIIKDIIDYFIENIAKNGKKYIFFDEVQSAKEWYKWIKSYYDKRDDVKFFLSGSSSLALQKEASQYLSGRVVEMELFQMNFAEFLELGGIKIEINYSMKNINAIAKADPTELRKIHEKIKNKFNEYLLVGGFPEWAEVKDVERWFLRLVNDVPKKAVYEDAARLFEIKNPKILESVLAFIAANQSRMLSYEKICDVVKIDRGTLVNYIEYLKSSYLIIEILKHAGIKEQIKAMKKFLLIDQGIRNAILKDYELRENNIGFVIENVVGASLFMYCKKTGSSLTYLRKNGEIDFILNGKQKIPIEVKYRQNIDENEIYCISDFVKKNNLPFGIVVTKDILDKKNRILFIPCWLFLLALSSP